jgi:hypothetical protein
MATLIEVKRGCRETVTVMATIVSPGLAVHKWPLGKQWVITHAPSGYVLARRFPTREAAVGMARELAAVAQWDAITEDEMRKWNIATGEERKKRSLIRAQVKAIRKTYPKAPPQNLIEAANDIFERRED